MKTTISFLFLHFKRIIFLFCFLTFSSGLVNGQIKCSGIKVTPDPVCAGGNLNLSSLGYLMDSTTSISFIDISATGTNLPGDPIEDDSENNIGLPFAFTYFGTSYTNARIGNNGILVFGSTEGEIEYGNNCLPTSTLEIGNAGEAAICAYWDDLSPKAETSIKTKLVGTKFIIQWTKEDQYDVDLGNTITFQIQLEQTTNKIYLVYQDVILGNALYNAGNTATIGLNFNSTSAYEYSCNTESLINGRSISFIPLDLVANLSYAWIGPGGFSSSSPTPTINNCTLANSGLYTVTVSNGIGGFSSVSSSVAVVNCIPLQMKVKAFIQGYYLDGGIMTPALFNQGVPGATEAMTDSVTVQFHKTDPTGADPLAFYTIIDSYKAVIDTAGNVSGSMNSAVVGSYYFLSIITQNVLLTVSADSIRFNAANTSYDFTDNDYKAYGSNQNLNNDGTFSIYSGDLSRDEYIATDDVSMADNENILGSTGYNYADLSGDGYVGTDDVSVADNNNFLGLVSLHY